MSSSLITIANPNAIANQNLDYDFDFSIQEPPLINVNEVHEMNVSVEAEGKIFSYSIDKSRYVIVNSITTD